MGLGIGISTEGLCVGFQDGVSTGTQRDGVLDNGVGQGVTGI